MLFLKNTHTHTPEVYHPNKIPFKFKFNIIIANDIEFKIKEQHNI